MADEKKYKTVKKAEEEKKDKEISADAPVAEAPVVKDAVEKSPEPEVKTTVAPAGPEELPAEIREKLEKRKLEQAKSVAKLKRRKKKEAKRVTVGKAYIKATYNNTIISLTDLNGNLISWASAGIAGFKGPKKSTPYAASIIARIAIDKAKELGLQEVSVYVKGVGTGRESAIRALNANGLAISSIKDITPIPHNGCRPRKPRRV